MMFHSHRVSFVPEAELAASIQQEGATWEI